ncbi:hypothetical protein FKM82_010002 [Ascaphus truei]
MCIYTINTQKLTHCIHIHQLTWLSVYPVYFSIPVLPHLDCHRGFPRQPVIRNLSPTRVTGLHPCLSEVLKPWSSRLILANSHLLD